MKPMHFREWRKTRRSAEHLKVSRPSMLWRTMHPTRVRLVFDRAGEGPVMHPRQGTMHYTGGSSLRVGRDNQQGARSKARRSSRSSSTKGRSKITCNCELIRETVNAWSEGRALVRTNSSAAPSGKSKCGGVSRPEFTKTNFPTGKRLLIMYLRQVIELKSRRVHDPDHVSKGSSDLIDITESAAPEMDARPATGFPPLKYVVRR